ncbi:MAG: hypothetical protein ACREC5_00895, partial [Thermoplasmata archaeon]
LLGGALSAAPGSPDAKGGGRGREIQLTDSTSEGGSREADGTVNELDAAPAQRPRLGGQHEAPATLVQGGEQGHQFLPKLFDLHDGTGKLHP